MWRSVTLAFALVAILGSALAQVPMTGAGRGAPGGGGGGGTVTFDAKMATPTNATGTSVSGTMTVGSSSGRALVAKVWNDSASTTPTGLGCVWDAGGTNQTMTAIVGTNSGTNGGLSAAAVLFGLVAPTSGTKTLTCSWTGSTTIGLFAESFSGANAAGGTTTFPNGNFTSNATVSPTPVSVTITSATNHKVVALYLQNCNAFGAVTGTQLFPEFDLSNTAATASYANGASTVAMSAAYTGSCNNIATGTDISP